jgi:hypothetical protein
MDFMAERSPDLSSVFLAWPFGTPRLYGPFHIAASLVSILIPWLLVFRGKKLSKGDIILERSGGTNDNPVGRVVYFEEDGVYLFNNFTQLLRCKEGVNSLFIFYSLFNYYQMNKNVIRSMGNKTTGIQNLKMDRYWQIPIADVSIERQKEFETIYRQADKSESVNFYKIAS